MPRGNPIAYERPIHLDQPQLGALNDWKRERSFFVSGISSGELLSEYQRHIRMVDLGEKGYQDFDRSIREYLKSKNYEAPVIGAGGIKDLSSWLRLRVISETNVGMARGYRQWMTFAGSDEYVAWRFFRGQYRHEPRWWGERWEAARSMLASQDEATPALGDGYSVGGTVGYALMTSPIWLGLSRFGTPYPPYDFLSGMQIAPCSREEAVSAGLKLPQPPESPLESTGIILPSFNATLESNPSFVTAPNRKRIEESLKGFVRVVESSPNPKEIINPGVANPGMLEGDSVTYEFTDPTGTRPGMEESIARLITSELPPGFQQRQADALRNWKLLAFTSLMPEFWDLARLAARVEPVSEATYFARPGDVARRSELPFLELSDKETPEFSYPVTTANARPFSKIGDAVGAKTAPFVLPL